MAWFIFVIAIIVSSIDAFLLAKYFRKPTSRELDKKVKRYNDRNELNPADWKHILYYKTDDGTEDYRKVPTEILLDVILCRTVAPLGLLVLGAILFLIDRFYN